MNRMIKGTFTVLLLFAMIMSVMASTLAEPVVKNQYVFLDYTGEYTGQTDSNGIPFGFGVFVSSTPIDGELWHYIGQWEDGLPEGEGAIYFENGDMQKGTFSKGVMTEGLNYAVAGLSATPVQSRQIALEDDEPMYIGNKKSKKFHYPSCKSVGAMKESNKVEFSSREEAISRQYQPCGECNP